MVGVATVPENLSNEQLVAAIQKENIRFGSKPSAVYHVMKHPTSPPAAFVRLANATLRARDAAAAVSVGQDGDVRLVAVRAAGGRAFVLERAGRVFLCTFMPNH